jgi:hypothetical protein
MIINDSGDKIVKHITKIKHYPEELDGSWYCITVLENHPILHGMGSFYFNDEYPSGTLIVSNYIFDQYPDIYATWDKDYMSNRMFVSPKLRKSGKGKAVILAGDQAIKYLFGHEIKYNYGKHENGDFLFNGVASLNKQIENKNVDDSRMFDFRDPAYPLIHFDKRFIGYEV